MPLHSLPAELLLHILSRTPSITALFALATTCRRLYAVFRSSQASLLYSVLAAELGPVLPDALGLAHIEVLDGSRGASRARYIAGIDAALDAYGGSLDGGEDGLREQKPELDEVLRLVRTYRTVGWVAGLYERCMMGLFENEVRPACSGSEESARAVMAPFSLVERLRVLRAFYRLQMALHIWRSSAVGSAICNNVAPRVNKRLFGLWETWQVQQVFVAGAFLGRLRRELADVWYGQQNEDPRCQGLRRRFCSIGQFRRFVEESGTEDQEIWREVVDRGSRLLLGAEAAGLEEVSNFSWYPGLLSDWCKTQGPIARHGFPVPLRFEGDCVDGVPFGWVDAFGGHYAYDFFLQARGLRRAGQQTQGLWSRLGFVMWDIQRVKTLKTASFLSSCARGWARTWMVISERQGLDDCFNLKVQRRC